MTAQGSVCEDFGWNFFQTPMYNRYHKFVEASTGKAVKKCSREELKELQHRKFRDQGMLLESFNSLNSNANDVAHLRNDRFRELQT